MSTAETIARCTVGLIVVFVAIAWLFARAADHIITLLSEIAEAIREEKP